MRQIKLTRQEKAIEEALLLFLSFSIALHKLSESWDAN